MLDATLTLDSSISLAHGPKLTVGLTPSGATFRRIRLNYLWAFGYNSVMIPVAAGVLYAPVRLQLPPWVAGATLPILTTAESCS